jgi:hypothetical protein
VAVARAGIVGVRQLGHTCSSRAQHARQPANSARHVKLAAAQAVL